MSEETPSFREAPRVYSARFTWLRKADSSTVGSVFAYAADLYVVACEFEGRAAKLFQIGFSGSDGSIFVAFPYLKKGGGNVGVVTLRSGLTYPADFTTERLPFTSHRVKYSHHPSGKAHFSLTGRVRTSVGKNAVRLDEAGGHVFTASFQGVEEFVSLNDTDRKGKRGRGVVLFEPKKRPIRSLKFVAFLYPLREMVSRGQTPADSAWGIFKNKEGKLRQGIVLRTPLQKRGEPFFLCLTMEECDEFDHGRQAALVFFGGFDHPEIAGDHSKHTSFLFCSYPAPPDDSANPALMQCIDL